STWTRGRVTSAPVGAAFSCATRSPATYAKPRNCWRPDWHRSAAALRLAGRRREGGRPAGGFGDVGGDNIGGMPVYECHGRSARLSVLASTSGLAHGEPGAAHDGHPAGGDESVESWGEENMRQ